MPRGPKGQKRPRDPNQLAKLIANIATGQVEDHETAPEVKREKRVRSAKAPVDSGAKRNRFKRSGFERLCQAL